MVTISIIVGGYDLSQMESLCAVSISVGWNQSVGKQLIS